MVCVTVSLLPGKYFGNSVRQVFVFYANYYYCDYSNLLVTRTITTRFLEQSNFMIASVKNFQQPITNLLWNTLFHW